MVDFSLSISARRAEYFLRQYDEINSTNETALEWAKKGANKKIWFVSDNQIRGRGRCGRVWQSYKGNLAASLLIYAPAKLEKLANLGFVAAIALYLAVGEILQENKNNNLHLAIKWPNDILLNGKKLAGILLETRFFNNKQAAIIIGFGVNIKNAPKNLPFRAVSLKEHNIEASAQKLFFFLGQYWVEIYEIWQKADGAEEILNLWRKFAYGIGSEIVLEKNGQKISGIFENIDEKGRLILLDKTGERHLISAADVFFGSISGAKNRG